MKLKKIFLLTFLSAFNTSVIAKNIVKGNVRIPNSKIDLLIAGVKTPQAAKSILFESGLFSQVEVKESGSDFLITLEEKPVASSLSFKIDGVSKKKRVLSESYKRLTAVSGIILGQVFDEQTLEQAKLNFDAFYSRSGYSSIKVKSEVKKMPSGGYEIEFIVDRGPKLKLDEIIFVGADNLDHRALRKSLSRREKSFLIYKKTSPEPYALLQDYEKIITFAKNEGFLEAKIKTSFVKTEKGKQKIFIIMEEGPCFNLGQVSIDYSDLPVLVKNTKLKKGILRAYKVDIFENYIKSKYSKKGYRVKVQTQMIPNGNKMDLHFKVVPSKGQTISRIEIRGNSITRENVVRNNMGSYEGDYYDSHTLKSIKTHLEYSGLFEEVSVIDESDEDGNKILIIDLKESKLGEIGFNFSTSFGQNAERSLSLYYSHPNFLGKQHSFTADVSLGNKAKSFQISYGWPSFLGYRIPFFVEGFRKTDKTGSLDFPDSKNLDVPSFKGTFTEAEVKQASSKIEDASSVSYSIKKTGVAVGSSFAFGKFGAASVKIRTEKQKFSHEKTAMRFFSKGYFPVSRGVADINITHSKKKVDDFSSPRKGWIVSHNHSLLLGNKTKALKSLFSLEAFYPLNRFKTVYLSSLFSVGKISKGSNNYWVDNFSASEVSLSGFRRSGPMERNKYTPLGGKRLLSGMIELNAPSIFPPAWGVKTFAGIYSGCVWKTGINPNNVIAPYFQARNWKNSVQDISSDKFLMRFSASAGIRWKLGPFKLEWYWTKVMKKDKESDVSKKFTFNISM